MIFSYLKLCLSLCSPLFSRSFGLFLGVVFYLHLDSLRELSPKERKRHCLVKLFSLFLVSCSAFSLPLFPLDSLKLYLNKSMSLPTVARRFNWNNILKRGCNRGEGFPKKKFRACSVFNFPLSLLCAANSLEILL